MGVHGAHVALQRVHQHALVRFRSVATLSSRGETKKMEESLIKFSESLPVHHRAHAVSMIMAAGVARVQMTKMR